MRKIGKQSIIGALSVLGILGSYAIVSASDHDDGVSPVKTKALNLTDLYAFREDNQTGNAADRGNLVLIMNSHPHTPPGEQGFFSTNGQYNFNLTRVTDANKNNAPTGASDLVLRFEFGAPDASQRQPITMKLIRNGTETAAAPVAGNGGFLTTSIADSRAGSLKSNRVSVGGSEVTVFAGMREDPFFFDFEQFVKVRAGALGLSTPVSFLPPESAVDYFRNENINTIVVRVPISLLQSAGEPLFDVWETITLKQ